MNHTQQCSGLSTALVFWLIAGAVAALIYPDSAVFGKTAVWGILMPAVMLAWLHWSALIGRAIGLMSIARTLVDRPPRTQARYVR